MRAVRVVLVGDEGVGKSTLISSLIKEEFVQLPSATVLPEVTVPSSSGPSSTLHIIDTSPRRDDRAHLESEIKRANVVGIVYAIDDPQSFDRIVEYWLPTLRSLGVNLPVVLIANKIDLRTGDVENVTNEALEAEVLPIMADWKEVETCVEVSAKALLQVPELFYHAQRACLYPTAPLYDTREHTLKPACVTALQRIFHLCDGDKDGLLNDDELNRFQRKCFGTPLQQSELDGLKAVVREHFGTAEADGLSEEGFLLIHSAFVQQGRLETTWTVLREFGYGEDLTLKESFLYPRFDVPSECSVELSPVGFAFLTNLFERHDKVRKPRVGSSRAQDQDGALSEHELDELFAVSPGNPWLRDGFPATTITNDAGHVTLQGWLAQWSLTTLLDHRVTLSYLAYLGFGALADPPIPLTAALKTSAPRKVERRSGKVQRNVFLVYCLGGAGCGKSSLLSAFVGKRQPERYEPTNTPRSVVNSVEYRGAEKYLVEFGRHEAEALRNSRRLHLADLILLCYDSSDTNSFSYISNLRQQYKLDSVPSVFVATKSDLDLAQQRHEVQPEEYCNRLSLPPPVAVSRDRVTDLFTTVVAVALSPAGSIPGGVRNRASSDRFTYALWMTVIGCGTGVVGFLAWRQFSRSSTGITAWLTSLRSGREF